jgi:hypothetical protein
VGAATLFAGTALADEKTDCIAAHENGQVARRAGHFDRAREAFAACQADACPSLVRSRCADFARELEAAQPSIVVVVVDDHGGPAGDARISIDGGSLAPPAALAVRLDPAKHTVHAEAPGFLSTDKTVTVPEGLKNMEVLVTLARPTASAQLIAAGFEAAGPTPTTAPSSDRNTPAWGFAIAGGVGLVGAGALSATGWVIHGNLKSSCGSTAAGCTSDQVEPLRVIWPASFVALGVGVASAVVATVLFATHSNSPKHPSTTAWAIGPGAAEITFP